MPGSDADIIVLNPNTSFRITTSSHHSRSDTNVYEGKTGKVSIIYQTETIDVKIKGLTLAQLASWLLFAAFC